jgi:hypothetical protein
MNDTIKDSERCANEHSARDFDGSRISVPCGAVATRRPIIDDAYSAHLRATGDTSEDAQPSPLPTCEDCYQQLLKDVAEQKADDPYRVWISAEPRTVVIGYTKMHRTTGGGYVPMVDGYRPGAAQHVLTVTVDLAPELSPDKIAELVFHATNAQVLTPGGPAQAIYEAVVATGYRGEEAHWSLSVGDTVTVDGVQLACQAAGWTPVTRWTDAKAARYGELEAKRKGLSAGEVEAWSQSAESKELEGLAVERWEHRMEHPGT